MADVRVKYTGKQPIVVNGVTWLEDEIHTINEKLARSLVAFGEAIVVLPPLPSPPQGEGVDGTDKTSMKVILMPLTAPTNEAVADVVEEPLPSPPQSGEGAVDEAEAIEVVEEKPARRKRK